MQETLDIIRLIGPEFDEVPEKDILSWIALCAPMVSKKRFGNLYHQALAYLICHKLKMAGKGEESPLGDAGKIGVGFAVGSVSEGGSSISFGANQSTNLATDAELALTSYGLQFLSIRRMVIIPIHMSTEGTEYGNGF